MATADGAIRISESHTVKGQSHKDLADRLDELFEEYLGLLNDYTEAREQLSRDLSNGFMSLAQANFTSPNRTRYGQDYYDERMQALKTVEVESEAAVQFKTATLLSSAMESKGDESAGKSDSSGGEDAGRDPKKSSKPEGHATSIKKEAKTVTDPIRWFGVLVPPALRSAQGHFTATVDGPIQQLVNKNKAMEVLEIEIRRTKKKLSKVL
ncbi:hypothetical protein FH972_023934 [Carpinus fangiana]|uniref:Vacuolar ATPase assembly protein VMA22 n=1 Tax=Carpinus fangiana TaxID=176857 RepID=A0A5N6KWL8_9ROSI|nr:hypothetical protein FH972_023934 [Carpinus fangiana]